MRSTLLFGTQFLHFRVDHFDWEGLIYIKADKKSQSCKNGENKNQPSESLLLKKCYKLLFMKYSYISGDDTKGRPKLTPFACSCSLGGVSVKIHGDAAWFLNLFKGKIADMIKKSLQGKVLDVTCNLHPGKIVKRIAFSCF